MPQVTYISPDVSGYWPGAIQINYPVLGLPKIADGTITADISGRGVLYVVSGAAGVADVLYIVLKNHANGFKAVPLVSGIT